MKSNAQIYREFFLAGLSALLGSMISVNNGGVIDLLGFEDVFNPFIKHIVSTTTIIFLFFICIVVLEKILSIVPYKIFDIISDCILLFFAPILFITSFVFLFLKEYKEFIVFFFFFIIDAIFVFKYVWKDIYNPNKKRTKK